MFREFWFGLFPWFSPCFVRAGAVRLPGVLDRVPGCPFLAGLLGLRASSFIFSSEEGSSEFFGALSVLPGLLIVSPRPTKPVYAPPRHLTCPLKPNVPHEQFSARNVVAKGKHRGGMQKSLKPAKVLRKENPEASLKKERAPSIPQNACCLELSAPHHRTGTESHATPR